MSGPSPLPARGRPGVPAPRTDGAVASRTILGLRVDATSYADATTQVLAAARAAESRCVCVANVHLVMEALGHPAYQQIIADADLVTPDGVPLVWALRCLGVRGQERVYGPTLTLHVCEAAAREGVPVGFYGGSPETLEALARNLTARFPALRIAYSHSPPFRPLTEDEDRQVVAAIAGSGARILFVGLGCPKQEEWMAAHKGRVRAVMLGVGAAFDFHAGTKRQAPHWMMRCGLEWLFRLASEPRRLWWRYLYHNPRFLWHFGLQLLGRSYGPPAAQEASPSRPKPPLRGVVLAVLLWLLVTAGGLAVAILDKSTGPCWKSARHILVLAVWGLASVYALRAMAGGLRLRLEGSVLLAGAALSEIVQFWMPNHMPEWAGLAESVVGVGAALLASVLWVMLVARRD